MNPIFSIYTLSLGKHIPLSARLHAAASAGFTGIELDTEDWYSYARSFCAAETLKFDSEVAQAAAANALAHDVSSLGLTILCLQPLRHFEGLLDEKTRASRFSEATALLRAMVHLRTNLLLIPSSFLPPHLVTGDRDRLISDFRKLSDIASSIHPKLRIGYEALAWGTYIDTWQGAWALIQGVSRPNFGLVLDSFNMLGRIYADPTKRMGVSDDAETAYRSSLAELVSSVPTSYIFLLQIADGARLEKPIDCSADLPRLLWSRSGRLFPGEYSRGAYLPVEAFMRAVVKEKGFKGAWSIEYFNADLERRENGEAVAKELAERGMRSLEWLSKKVKTTTRENGDAVVKSITGRSMTSLKWLLQEAKNKREVGI